jgi:protein SCO1/2
MPRPHLLRYLLIAAVALAAGFALALRSRPPAPVYQSMTVLDAPRALPGFTLVTDTGPLAAGDLAGRWTLVFFGFASCPDICPTTLSLLGQVDRQLADLPVERRPRVLFVSVDPERDTPAAVQAYARHYGADFVGATGSTEELTRFAAALGAPFAKVVQPDGSYTMDHSGAVFVLDPGLRFGAVMTPPLVVTHMAADLRQLVTR